MRKGATSVFAKVFLAVITIVFIFWGVGFYRANQQIVAKVNGQPISLREFNEFYNFKLAQLKQTFGEVNSKFLKKLNFRKRVLDELIVNKLLEEKARELGIKITKQEVEEAIQRIPAFQEEGSFSPQRYAYFLRNLGVSSQFFESLITMDLIKNKLRLFLTTPIVSSTDETIHYLNFLNQKFLLKVASLPFSFCQALVKPTEQNLKNYFLAHRDLYVAPARVKLRYVYFPFKGSVTIKESEIKDYYRKNLHRFKEPMKVKLIKIFIKGTSNKSLQKAETIVKKVKKAKDLERFTQEKPHWFEESSLPPEISKLLKVAREGQILGPIRVRDGYLILGIEKIQPEHYLPFSKVEKEIEKELKYEKLRTIARKKAEKLYIEAVKEGELAKAAKKLGFQAKKTDYLTKPALIDMIDSFENANKIFSANAGEIFPPIESAHGVYVFELIEKIPPRNLTFKEAYARVKKDFLRDETRERCKERALRLITLWQKGFSENAARKLGFEVKAGQTTRLQEKRLFKVSKPGVIDTPFIEKNKVKVIFVEKILPAEKKYSQEEIRKARFLLTVSKRENFWARWLKEALEEARVEVKK